ncbi:MAG: glycoside hydrolase family 31 protein [Bacteroidia bacterium]|nr:DUF4968 domain-containing protein [Bacteroidia bacterium]MCZ2276851.1 glycoside hydrolase family 31 protein [Bacteroidia bacterium]
MEVSNKQTPSKDYPGAVKQFIANSHVFEFVAVNARLHVYVLTDKVFRFRYTPEVFHKDFSYAIDPAFKPSVSRVSVKENEDSFLITTLALRVKISKKNLEVLIEDLNGNILSEDIGGYHFEPNQGFGGYYVYCSKRILEDECFYGLGDKSSNLNLRGRRFLNWGTDTYGFAKEQDPLYKNIPFFYGLTKGKGYGIFFDNTFQTFFDFGFENPEVLSFWAEGGEMNYYFIYGPELISVAEQYTDLTGRPELAPLWSLGYQQSKWSYSPESKVREVAQQFRSRKIPCDVIHLDIDYMDGYRCFTWDNERFPDPAKLIQDLEKDGFKIVTIIDPGIKIDTDYFVYQQGIENAYFCRRQDGDLMRGKVWPGECHFPDFTHPDVRNWWAGLCSNLTRYGVAGIWNDMNEPAVFESGTFPDDVRHYYEGLDVSHRRTHNVYGMQMARASYEGMKKQLPEKRPFVITRSGYSGVQRYASVWTGDNVASWEHLWIGNIQCQRMSVSGVSFIGTDIGGFIGEPDGELFVRYIQMAVFHLFFRGHSSADQGDKEPWAFGKKYEGYIRKTIELRYRLLPYIYSTFWQYVSKGTPAIRPLAFIDQHDSHTLLRNEEFGFGDHMLICPIGKPDVTGRKVYLPKGKWVNYFTQQEIEGGQEIWVEVQPDTFPLFVRSGAVIAHAEVAQHTSDLNKTEMQLHIYYSASRYHSWLYEDEGEGYAYTKGRFSVKKFSVFGNKRQMRVLQEKFGSYQAGSSEYGIHIHSLPFKPRRVMIDGQIIKLAPRRREKSVFFKAPVTFKRIEIH